MRSKLHCFIILHLLFGLALAEDKPDSHEPEGEIPEKNVIFQPHEKSPPPKVHKPPKSRRNEAPQPAQFKDVESSPPKIAVPQWAFLSHSKECKDDISRLCPRVSRDNNFEIMNCLQRDEKTAQAISNRCQHHLWAHKRNYTKSVFFDQMTNGVCRRDLANLTECSKLPQGTGQRIPCMIEYKQNVTNPECQNYLNNVGRIVFSDYRLVYKFADACNKDIVALKCGRVGANREESEEDVIADQPFSQGETIGCLVRNVDQIDKACRHEILRVAELQSDDFHLDRPLFYACRDDREKLCLKVEAGEGRVLACLMKHKFDPLMSTACRDKLTQRQALRQKDYHVDYLFSKNCDPEIRRLNCTEADKEVESDEKNSPAKLAAVMLCLEEKGDELKPECKSEVLETRKQLMEDYQVSPEIVLNCREVIKTKCHKGHERKGQTLHCLMDLGRNTPEHPGSILPPKCLEALEIVLKVAHAAEDIRVDPVIGAACETVIGVLCHDQHPDGSAVYDCLVEHLQHASMTEMCAEKLVELQYFVSRDFTMDEKLFRACQVDSQKLCASVQMSPDNVKPKKISVLPGPAIFNCLYQRMVAGQEAAEAEIKGKTSEEVEGKKDVPQVSKKCQTELHMALSRHAARIEFEPSVYVPCLSDLAKFCTHLPQKGQEVVCLQEHVDDLKIECQKAIMEVSAAQDKEPTLDALIARHCIPMVQRFCHSLTDDARGPQPGELMQCLILHKDDNKMEAKCRAGIEHHQIISLKNYTISYRFAKACRKDVKQHCADQAEAVEGAKAAVIACLSEVLSTALMKDETPPLRAECRTELRFELLQRSENINLDPRLKRDCVADIKKFCAKVEPGKGQVISCLREHQENLTPDCHKRIFKRELLQANDNRVDWRLQQACKRMIELHCQEQLQGHGDPHRLISCLFEAMQSDATRDKFDRRCRKVVSRRLELRGRDYRLDPRLQRVCKTDVERFCKKQKEMKLAADHEYQGQVIHCLKNQYANAKSPTEALTIDCQAHVRELILQSNLDSHTDPILRRACGTVIRELCTTELEETDGIDGDARVTECLKRKLANGEIKQGDCAREVLRLMGEARADVHVDPVLYRACANELRTICGQIPLGGGRQMACLLWARDDKEAKKHLSPTCSTQLKDRVDMWERAAKLAPPETLPELALQISTSPAKFYFVGVFGIMVAVIFLVGICCGRVTKRVLVEAKNK